MTLRLTKETRKLLQDTRKKLKLKSTEATIKKICRDILAEFEKKEALFKLRFSDTNMRKAEIKGINFLKKKKAAFPYEVEHYETESLICMIAKQWNLLKLSIENESLKKLSAREVVSLLLIDEKQAKEVWIETYLKRYFPLLLDADEEKLNKNLKKLKKNYKSERRLTEAKKLLFNGRLKTIKVLRHKLETWVEEIDKF